jgi:hypothetical protein
MADQVRQPNASGDKLVVLLMDGQESLWKPGGVYLPEELAEVTEILDLLHALGYLREAAPLIHPNDSTAARTFVKDQARRMFHGGAAAWLKAISVEAQPTVGAAPSPRRGVFQIGSGGPDMRGMPVRQRCSSIVASCVAARAPLPQSGPQNMRENARTVRKEGRVSPSLPLSVTAAA